MNPLISLENRYLKVVLYSDASGQMTDKETGADWTFNAVALQDYGKIVEEVVWTRGERSFCDYYGGRFQAVREGEHLRIRLFGRLNEDRGSFTCRVELDGPWVVFRIEEIDERLPSLTFPPHVHCDSLILPLGLGQWRHQESYQCRFMTGLTMRWFGHLQSDQDLGCMAVLEDGVADSGLYAKGLWVAPSWLKSMGRWGYPRSIRYRGTSGGYVGMAKVYRQYAKDHGMFRSLKEKIAESPAVGALHGGRIVSFFQSYMDCKYDPVELLHPWPHMERSDYGTGKLRVELSHADVSTIIRDAKALGMKKGIFNLRGTFHGGYDYAHPDIWPPEPALGTLDELKTIMAEQDGFVSLLHDNYQDFYPHVPSFPHGVLQTSTGQWMPGGFWHGGQCYITNPRVALEYARRNWEQLQTFQPRGVFVDTLAAVQPYEDYHPTHRLDRTGCYAAKLDMVKFYKEKGLIVGSENAMDFGMAYMDFLENRHDRKPNLTPPLWPLVFHDAAYCARYPGGNTSTTGVAGTMEDILWGYAVMWSAANPSAWSKNRDAFRHSLFVDEWHQRVGLDEMTHHRYLTEDGQVEQTEFSSGVSVIANFASEPRQVHGNTIPANDYLILE